MRFVPSLTCARVRACLFPQPGPALTEPDLVFLSWFGRSLINRLLRPVSHAAHLDEAVKKVCGLLQLYPRRGVVCHWYRLCSNLKSEAHIIPVHTYWYSCAGAGPPAGAAQHLQRRAHDPARLVP